MNFQWLMTMKMSHKIDLPFTIDSFRLVLAWGAGIEDSGYSHQDIAHWCERFWNKYGENNASNQIERIMPILADVETQWDLFLANTYSLSELQKINLDEVCLPKDWFHDWLKKI